MQLPQCMGERPVALIKGREERDKKGRNSLDTLHVCSPFRRWGFPTPEIDSRPLNFPSI